MKEWLVKIIYEYEGPIPFDLHAPAEYVVKATSETSALKKAEKLLMKEVTVQGILSYKCTELK